MRDMNIAKLTSQDSPLFLGIVQDLFPGVETPVIDYGKVMFRNRYVIRNSNFTILLLVGT